MKFVISCLIGLATAINTNTPFIKSQQHGYDMFTSQVLAQAPKVTCQTTPDRNKKALPDFYSLLNSSKKYTDPDFSPDSSSFYWKGHENWWSFRDYNYEWKRAKEMYPKNTLWGSNGV